MVNTLREDDKILNSTQSSHNRQGLEISNVETNTPSAQLALYLIENGRAQEVYNDFDNYEKILSDEIIFKLIDALDDKIIRTNVSNLDNIPQDILFRYLKWKQAKLLWSENTDSNEKYGSYLQYAPNSFKNLFEKFSLEEQKRLSEIIEFFPDMIAVKTKMKIEGEEKLVKISVDKKDTFVSQEVAAKTDEIETIDGNTYMTISWAKSITPENLQIKWSHFVAMADIFNTGEVFKTRLDMRSLKLVNELLGIERKGCIVHKGDKKVNRLDENTWCMTMGTKMKDGVSTGNPIVLMVANNTWAMMEMNTDFMAPVRKLSKPIEIL